MNIATVIVTYNRKQLLFNCLEAIKKQTYKPKTVYIVDNASTDGTYEDLVSLGYANEKEHEITQEGITFHIIKMPQNKGGAGGFCAGMKTAYENTNCDAIWVMDDDGVPEPNCLKNLIEYIDQFNYIAPVVRNIDNPKELAFGFWEISLYDDLIKKYKDQNYIKDMASPFNGILYSRKLIKEVGYPKKELFIWGDEINYDLRCKNAGFYPVTIIKAEHYHPLNRVVKEKTILGQSVIQAPMWKAYCSFRNRIYNYRHCKKKLGILKIYVAHCYYFTFQKPSRKWLLCYNKAFFAGLFGIFGGERYYMK